MLRSHDGKLDGGNVAAAHDPSGKSPRLFVLDTQSGFTFLIDCGSDVSVFPITYTKKPRTRTNYTLFAANNSPIHTYGLHPLEVDVGLPSHYVWNFVLADVHIPIIGADFLKRYHLLPDLTERKLVDGKTLCSTKCIVKITAQTSVSSVSKLDNEKVRQILAEFPELTKPPQYLEEPPRTIYHRILTMKGKRPIRQKARRLRADIVAEVEKEFQNYVKSGLCSVSDS